MKSFALIVLGLTPSVLSEISCGISHGYDLGTNAYFYSGDGSLANFDACSAKCQGSSECQSFAFGNNSCLLYYAPLDTNFRPQSNSPYLFYDRNCVNVQSTSSFATTLPPTTAAPAPATTTATPPAATTTPAGQSPSPSPTQATDSPTGTSAGDSSPPATTAGGTNASPDSSSTQSGAENGSSAASTGAGNDASGESQSSASSSASAAAVSQGASSASAKGSSTASGAAAAASLQSGSNDASAGVAVVAVPGRWTWSVVGGVGALVALWI